jgi:hypothetical protein
MQTEIHLVTSLNINNSTSFHAHVMYSNCDMGTRYNYYWKVPYVLVMNVIWNDDGLAENVDKYDINSMIQYWLYTPIPHTICISLCAFVI